MENQWQQAKQCSLRALRILFLPLVLVLAACEPSGLTSTGPTGRPGPVTVGLLVPAGAADPNVSAMAESLTLAAQMAAASHPDGLVTIRTYPTAGNQAQSVAVAQQAILDGADVILGPLYAQNAAAVGRAVAATNTSVLSFSNNTAVAGGNVFLMGNTFENVANQLGQFAVSRGVNRALIIYAKTPNGEFARQASEIGLSESGVQVVGSAGFEFSQEALAATLPAIAELAKNSGANALFLTPGTGDALPTLTNLLPSQGLGPDAIQYMGLTRWDIPRSATSLPGLQGGWFALPDPRGVATFNQTYVASNGAVPHPLAAIAYDGIEAIAAQAKLAGPAGLSPQALATAADFRGATGDFTFATSGSVRRDLAIASIQNNAVGILKYATPPDLSTEGS